MFPAHIHSSFILLIYFIKSPNLALLVSILSPCVPPKLLRNTFEEQGLLNYPVKKSLFEPIGDPFLLSMIKGASILLSYFKRGL